MNSGSIVGCSAYNCGGAVSARNGTFIMNGGSIIGCKTDFAGGAVYVLNGEFIMNSGSITDCVVTSPDAGDGGAVYVSTDGTFTMNGGSIADCTAVNGSALYLEKGTMNAGGGAVGGTVVLESNSTIQGSSIFSGLIINNNAQAQFSGAYSPLGIVGEKPTGANGYSYYTVAFALDGGNMSHTTRYFLQGKDISDEIKPDPRTGYTFGGWYKADGTAWDYANDKVTDDITLYAKWIANTHTITFDTAGGSEIAPITQDYGSAITAPANPTREGYTFMVWDKEIPTTMPAENIKITAQWKINRYTITFDTAGGSEVAAITQDYGTAITAPANPTREGYAFMGWDKEIPATMPAENVVIKARWKDTEKPTGEIKIGENKWRSFLNKLTFGLFFADTQTVEITANDNSERVSIGYYLTELDLSEADFKSTIFIEYEGSFNIEPNAKYIVYVRLVDESLNITYLRSDRITLDNIAPVITGIENGKTYCGAQTITITDESLDIVTVNGAEVTLDENNNFVLTPAKVEQKIVATDKAGNIFEMTVTVNNGHTPSADDGDCSTPVLCKFCSQTVVAAKNHDFSGEWIKDENRHWHECLNENCTVTDTKTAHSGTDDGDCLTAVVCECGYVLTAAEARHNFGEWTSNGDGTHTRNCIVKDCRAVETENCSGGEATCTEKAECTVCGEKYGKLDPENHSGKTEWVKTETEHTERYDCCDAVTVKTENHEWADGVCQECGYVCAHKDTDKNHICDLCEKTITNHTGGKATCKDKAVCELCGKAYGEIDANNHADLKHIKAKAATKDAEGNTEYWYCEDCGKYYSDAAATKEITKSATVTAKLPDEPKSPQTGDNRNIVLWIALLFISGGAVIGTTVIIVKKKKRSAE